MRKAHVLRRVLGVPRQLLGQGVLGVEVEVAEQTLAGMYGHVANRADAVLIVARPARIALGVVHVDLGVFIELCSLGKRLGQIGPAVPRFQPNTFTPRITAACRSTRMDTPRKSQNFLTTWIVEVLWDRER